MSEIRKLLNGDDIISVSSSRDVILLGNKTFKVQEMMEELTIRIKNEPEDSVNKWCLNGVECEVLTPNKIWRKGKVKISLEFIPDEPEMNEIESPLDDIRQSMNQS